ncbi:hypothetical protein Lsan_4193 [Legionella santicrucis]|uniref:Uncharacterized protein n=1 Tax=Legionella santicrucis TaxID=45074 RepID=A0A0W0YA26_9GAMM|nr:hypothetical protein [Legionella santicrucis]KTD53783.1 hypothetical protein Lsan_4193 [Legionella santicrucis]
MKFIITKKNSEDSITLNLEPTATVNDLFLGLYEYRSKSYRHLSFSEYQKYISIYQYFLYGDQFKKKWLPELPLADFQPKDPCYLTWEESPESQYLLTHNNLDSIRSSVLFWQANTKSNKFGIDEDMSVQSRDGMGFW